MLATSLFAGCGGRTHQASPAPPPSVESSVASAVRLCDPGERGSIDRTRVCLERRLLAIVTAGGPTTSGVPRIDTAVRIAGGFVAENCHILMHWVGRNYAVDHHVTLGTLQRFLPRTNDPGCSAGFAHGLVSALAPAVRRLDPASTARVCARSPTRYQAYSCVHGLGHAYMRAYNETVPIALHQCARLPHADVVDCAQGVFHDYWFSVSGADGMLPAARPLTPRALCGRQARAFVRACWYRSFLESPPERSIAGAGELGSLCTGLVALQRDACITGASAWFDSGDPYGQLDGCSQLPGADAVACARGVATQDLLRSPLAAKVRLIRRCDRFGNRRAPCLEWIAKALNVVADGRFLRLGCRALPTIDRAPCHAGAASWRGPLETFS